jgi:hypothetical protein
MDTRKYDESRASNRIFQDLRTRVARAVDEAENMLFLMENLAGLSVDELAAGQQELERHARFFTSLAQMAQTRVEVEAQLDQDYRSLQSVYSLIPRILRDIETLGSEILKEYPNSNDDIQLTLVSFKSKVRHMGEEVPVLPEKGIPEIAEFMQTNNPSFERQFTAVQGIIDANIARIDAIHSPKLDHVRTRRGT